MREGPPSPVKTPPEVPLMQIDCFEKDTVKKNLQLTAFQNENTPPFDELPELPFALLELEDDKKVTALLPFGYKLDVPIQDENKIRRD